MFLSSEFDRGILNLECIQYPNTILQRPEMDQYRFVFSFQVIFVNVRF